MNKDYDLTKVKPKPYAHSSWKVLNVYGGIKVVNDCWCYYPVHSSHRDGEIKRVTFFFGKNTIREKGENYFLWLANRSPFRGMFLTKTWEGLKTKGVEVKTNVSNAEFKTATMLLRNPFEFEDFDWDFFKAKGAKDYQALALTRHLVLDKSKKVAYRRYADSLHWVLQERHSLESFKFNRSKVSKCSASTEDFGTYGPRGVVSIQGDLDKMPLSKFLKAIGG